MAGFLGGLVSSTGVSIHLARLAHRQNQQDIIAAGVLVACATMFVRVLLVVTILNTDLARPLIGPLLLMAIPLFTAAVIDARKSESTALDSLQLRNPVELGQAFKFALLLAAVLVASKAVQSWLGDKGLYLLAALAGISDVDAISISLARAAPSEFSLGSAVQCIIVATLINTITKGVLVWSFGNPTLGRKVILPMAFSVFIGIGATLFMIR